MLLSFKSRHMGDSALQLRSHGSQDWSWCCEHAVSDDFRRAVCIMQPHLPFQHLDGRCCALRPAEVYVRSCGAPNGRGAAEVAVQVSLGASGASLFRLQVQSATAVAVAPNSVNEPLFELIMPTGACIQLRGMANYGVASYCAALGQLLDSQQLQHPPSQQQQQRRRRAGACANATADTAPRRSPLGAAAPVPAPVALALRNCSQTYSRSHPMRSCGGGGGSGLPIGSPPCAASAAAASCGVGRLARSVPSWQVLSGGDAGGGRGAPAAAAKAAAAKAAAVSSNVSGWFDLLLRTADTSDGGGDGGLATTCGCDLGCDDDDLRPDAADGDGGSRRASAAGFRAVRVTAWVRGSHAELVKATCDELRLASPPPTAVANRGDGALPAGPKEPSPAAEASRCLQAAAAAADGVVDDDHNDVVSDAGASKVFIGMRRAPDSGPRRNAHLLRLLGLPPAACSLRIPVPELDPDVPYGPVEPLLDDLDDCASLFGLREEEEAPSAEPGWAAEGFGCEFQLPRRPPLPSAPGPAAAAAALGRSCIAAASGEGSYSLEGSDLGHSFVTAAAAVVTLRGPCLAMAAQLQQQQQLLLLQHQERRAAALAPAAVEVVNLLGGSAATPALQGCCRGFAVSYIDSLDWYAEDEFGVVAQQPNGDPGYPSSLFSDDDVAEPGGPTNDSGTAAVAAAAAGAVEFDDGAWGCRLLGDGGDGGAPEGNHLAGGFRTTKGCGAPPSSLSPPTLLPPTPLLTSLTTEAVWL